MVLAIALFLSQFAKACTTNNQAWLNVWETFFPSAVAPSENFRWTFHTVFHLVTTSNSALAGAISQILFILIYIHKLFNDHSQSSQTQFLLESFWLLFFTNGQLSVLELHFQTTTWSKSSTIHTGLFIQSPSISSSHTFQIQSQSTSIWLGL